MTLNGEDESVIAELLASIVLILNISVPEENETESAVNPIFYQEFYIKT